MSRRGRGPIGAIIAPIGDVDCSAGWQFNNGPSSRPASCEHWQRSRDASEGTSEVGVVRPSRGISSGVRPRDDRLASRLLGLNLAVFRSAARTNVPRRPFSGCRSSAATSRAASAKGRPFVWPLASATKTSQTLDGSQVARARPNERERARRQGEKGPSEGRQVSRLPKPSDLA